MVSISVLLSILVMVLVSVSWVVGIVMKSSSVTGGFEV